MEKRITTPLTEETLRSLKAGENLVIDGVIYTGRDAAHKRLVETMDKGEPLPVDFTGQIIYYVGPCPAKPGHPIGSAGPTTSGRMDSYTPAMLNVGLKGMIGKGNRSAQVVDAIKEYGAVYLLAIGGAGALLAKCVKKAEVVAYEELGPEAIFRLEVENFPVVVGVDTEGNDIYVEGRKAYAR